MITGLRDEEEIKNYKDALVGMQRELEDVKQTVETTNRTACTGTSHYEEFRAELQPTQTREKVRPIVKGATATGSVEVIGVKPISQATVKSLSTRRRALRISAELRTG